MLDDVDNSTTIPFSYISRIVVFSRTFRFRVLPASEVAYTTNFILSPTDFLLSITSVIAL